MGRLTKQTKAAITKKQVGAAKSDLPKYTLDDEIKFITQEKIDILNHPAKYTDWIGAKDGGKTRPVILRELGIIETDTDAYGLSLKKYKSGAVARLHTAINNMALEIKFAGFNIPDYEKGVSQTYKMKNWKQKSKNQSIEYASFDDSNGLAGIEAPNLGYIPIVHYEEIVLQDDPGKLPNEKEWYASTKTVEDSVDRSNRRYRLRTGNDIPDTKYHATMNAWDSHPVIDNAEKYFPEAKFLAWVQEDFKNNHTRAVYVEEQDRLIVRLTKFANPELENADEIVEKCKQAIREDDSFELARLLGMRYEGSETNGKTWNMERIITGDTTALLKAADRLEGIAVAWDIDHNRQLVATPVYHVKKQVGFSVVENLLIGKQRVIPTSGGGKGGAMIPIFTELMKEINKEIVIETMKIRGTASLPNLSMLWFDDDKDQYTYQMMDQTKYFGGVAKAKKHGDWGIIERTDNIQIGIDNGFYIFDESNVTLFNKMKISIIKEGSTKRDESGRLEKDYDEINSMEYAIYMFRYLQHGVNNIGSVEDYIKKVGNNG